MGRGRSIQESLMTPTCHGHRAALRRAQRSGNRLAPSSYSDGVSTHPLWRPFELADLDEVAQVRVGDGAQREIVVAPYDEAWPTSFAELDATVRGALGERVL